MLTGIEEGECFVKVVDLGHYIRFNRAQLSSPFQGKATYPTSLR
jgi:hypothetical protein